jgi:acetyl esterase
MIQQLLRGSVRRVFALPQSFMRRIAGPPRLSDDGYQLDLHTQLLLRFVGYAGDLHDQGVERSRRRMDVEAPLVDLPPRVVDTQDLTSPLPMRLYRPKSPRGTLVYFHGGGWVIGSIRSHDGVCRALADDTGRLVVSVGYRLGPEHRYPAAIDDALLATRWVLEQHGGPVAVAGDSAGGHLAAWVALELRDQVERQLLVYPATDLTRSHASHRQFRDGYLLTQASMDWFLEHWLAPAEYRAASPLYVENLRGAPTAMVMTAGFDPLRDEGRAYAARLRQAGVAVEDRLFPSLIHGFFSMAGALPAARAAYGEAVAFLTAGGRARG